MVSWHPLGDMILEFNCGHTLTIPASHLHSFRTERELQADVYSRQCQICGKHATDFGFDGYLR